MKYTLPPDYQSLILSVGYYCTVRKFRERTSALALCWHQIQKTELSVGSCLDEGVGEGGGPHELVFGELYGVGSLYGGIYLCFFVFFCTKIHSDTVT